MYLFSNEHPYIQFAVHQFARCTHCPQASHEEGIKNIFRYLQGFKGQVLTFKPNIALQLNCYVDADFSALWNFDDDQYPVCVNSQIRCVLTMGG